MEYNLNLINKYDLSKYHYIEIYSLSFINTFFINSEDYRYVINTHDDPKLRVDMKMYCIYEGYGDDDVYIPASLVDSDYPKIALITLYNRRSKEVDLNGKTLTFKAHKFFAMGIPASRYPYINPLDTLPNHDYPWKFDKLQAVVRGSLDANGLDLEFNKEYMVLAKGILVLRLENFLKYRETETTPFMFLLRSRFSRMGLLLHYKPIGLNDQFSFEFIIQNTSSRDVFIGDRFMQYIPCHEMQHINMCLNLETITQKIKPRKEKENVWDYGNDRTTSTMDNRRINNGGFRGTRKAVVSVAPQ